MPEPVKLTPEEEAVQEQVKALGLTEGSVILDEGGAPVAEPVVVLAAPVVVPAAPAAPVPPKDDAGTLKEWAER